MSQLAAPFLDDTVTTPAPLTLFVYKRAEHTARTIAALKACDGFATTPITVFSDGPKAPADAAAVAAVRALIGRELPDAKLVTAGTNQGLARSIIAGTGTLVRDHGRVIVIEDDLLVAADFLTFMNAALDRYADDPRVMQVSGYLPPLTQPLPTAAFMYQTSSWTWGTWARAWRQFEAEPVGTERLTSDPVFRRRFNRNGQFDYAKMLDVQRRGGSDSWAIRWYWSVFKAGGLTLYPRQTMVANIGFDGSGTHGARGVRRDTLQVVAPARQGPVPFPERVEVDRHVEADVNRAYRASLRSPVAWLRAALRRLLGPA